MDGGYTAEEEGGGFRGFEKEIGGREYECCYGYGLRWEIGWRGGEKKDAGKTASGSVPRRVLND